jgi:hypothetical protein
MTKQTILCTALCVLAQLAQAQTGQATISLVSQDAESIVLDVQLGDYHIDQIELESGLETNGIGIDANQIFSAIQINGGSSLLRKGAPDVPKLSTTVQIPATGKMAFEIIKADYKDIEQIVIVPSKGNLSRQVNPADIAFELGSAYKTDAFYPEAMVSIQRPFQLRNTRGAHIWFHMAQYQPVTKTLRLYHQIRVRIYRTEEVGENELNQAAVTHDLGETLDDICRRLYVNATPIDYPNQKKGSSAEPEKMLVICPDVFLSEIEPLVTWKRQMGIKTTVIATSQLPGTDTSSVVNYVRQMYQTEGIQYLMLVGDDSYIKPIMRLDGTAYSCDNCFGYLSGDDNMPEVMVGRLHASTPTELRMMVARNLEYEKTPASSPVSDWLPSSIWLASNEGAGIGDDGQADWQHANAWKSAHLADGCGDFYELYDGDHSQDSPTASQTTADAAGNPQTQDIVDLMNNRGIGMYNYTGHGWNEGLVTGNFSTDAVPSLKNAHHYPILIAVACCAGNFTNPAADCLGEALQRARNEATGEAYGTIAGFLSSDFQSWAPPMEGQDAMNQYLIDADGTSLHPTIGGLAVYGNAKMIEKYDSDGALMAGFWNPFHEPSFVPRTRTPLQITATLPTQLYLGESTISVQSPVEGALVGIYFKGQTIGAGRVTGGVALIQFDALNDIGDLMVTVSQFNYLPYQQTVHVKPVSGPFVVQDLVELTDPTGNQNGLVDYGELISINLSLKNVGLAASAAVSTTLSSTDPYLTIIDGTEQWGVIEMASQLQKDQVFRFAVANYVPDQYIAQVSIMIDYGGTSPYITTIPVQLHAPKLQILSYTIDDQVGGNGNARLESGETAILRVMNQNIGSSDAPFANAYLQSSSAFVTVSAAANVGVLATGGQTKNAQFNVAVDQAAPQSLIVDFNYSLSAAAYSLDTNFQQIVVNAIIADFNGNQGFANFPFSQVEKPWTITQTQPYEGSHCARSGVIAHSSKSILQLDLDVLTTGQISFAHRVSCEADYDYLRFAIDQQEVEKWTGTLPWSESAYALNTGKHTMTWTYDKDELIAAGSDAAWIDEVVLPPFAALVATYDGNEAAFSVEVYPNPTTDVASITYTLSNPETLEIALFDASGKFLSTILPKSQVIEGQHKAGINLEQYATGIYFVHVKAESGTGLYRIVKR